MKILFATCVCILFLACNHTSESENANGEPPDLLHHVVPFTDDSLVNVVIEIPAGTHQKWEVNKETGQVEWEQIYPDSFRVINYLPYPANYGFVPQTLLDKAKGGDGDPVDVFVLGPSIARESIAQVRIVGIINMLDDNESDSKLLAVDINEPGFDVNSYEMLMNQYPGVVDIIKLWLFHYKGPNRVEILSVGDERDAVPYLKTAHIDYMERRNQ